MGAGARRLVVRPGLAIGESSFWGGGGAEVRGGGVELVRLAADIPCDCLGSVGVRVLVWCPRLCTVGCTRAGLWAGGRAGAVADWMVAWCSGQRWHSGRLAVPAPPGGVAVGPAPDDGCRPVVHLPVWERDVDARDGLASRAPALALGVVCRISTSLFLCDFVFLFLSFFLRLFLSGSIVFSSTALFFSS